MFKIQKDQIDALKRASIVDFENRMVAHLRSAFPEYAEHMTDPMLRDLIQHAITRADSYLIRNEYEVCLYLNMMVVLGRNFDVDARFPWARATLCDPADSVTTKIERLYDMAMQYEVSTERMRVGV